MLSWLLVALVLCTQLRLGSDVIEFLSCLGLFPHVPPVVLVLLVVMVVDLKQ